jgi:uncharacterized protein (TIGR00251 family)
VNFCEKKSDHFLLHIKATPNSSKTKISGIFTDEKNQQHLKINLAAVPEDGKANEVLIKFLSKILEIPKSKIEILRGENNRNKTVRIYGEFREDLLKF